MEDKITGLRILMLMWTRSFTIIPCLTLCSQG